MEEIPNNHHLGCKNTYISVNNGISTTTLNWLVSRISEPSTVWPFRNPWNQPNPNPPLQNHTSLSGSTASPAGLLMKCACFWWVRSEIKSGSNWPFWGFGQWEFLRPTKTQPLSWTQKPGTWMLASKATRKIHPQNLSKYETPNQCGKKK